MTASDPEWSWTKADSTPQSRHSCPDAAHEVQGLGAAIMMALTIAMVGDAAPKAKTGRAMGLLATMAAIGTALGPTLGAY
jgi:MFS family permease